MKEFIEKLIEELEDRIRWYQTMDVNSVPVDVAIKETQRIIELVNEVAEKYNNGWIPCSERLPEQNVPVLTCDKDRWMSVNINMPYKGAKNDFECGYYLAWQPLPQPYREQV